jgi:hypothetical protein
MVVVRPNRLVGKGTGCRGSCGMGSASVGNPMFRLSGAEVLRQGFDSTATFSGEKLPRDLVWLQRDPIVGPSEQRDSTGSAFALARHHPPALSDTIGRRCSRRKSNGISPSSTEGARRRTLRSWG